MLEDHNPDIVFLQETNLTAKIIYKPPRGYNVARRDRTEMRNANVGDKGEAHGGVVTLIKTEYSYVEVNKDVLIADNDTTTECIGIDVNVCGKEYRFINMYIPCIKTSQRDTRVDNFDPNKIKITQRTLIGADSNAHSKTWDKKYKEDDRGRILDEWETHRK